MSKLDLDYILTDGSEVMCAYNEIPSRCINNKGLVVYKKSEEWVSLAPGKPSLLKYDFSVEITPNNESVTGTGNIKYEGIDAVSFRRNYTNNEMLEEFITNLVFTQVDEVSSPGLTDRNVPLKITFNASAPVEQLENKVLISPFFNAPISENPLKQKSRKFPVDMIYQKGNMFQSEILIPENMKVVSLPENKDIDNNNIKINYSAQLVNKSKVLITGYYSFKKTVYSAKDYNALKYYFNLIISKLNEKIVLDINQNLN
jgi:hypothetical protein